VAWSKTHSFCVLGPFSWTISHNFGFPDWFTRTITRSTYLRCTTKNLSFCVFRAVFVSYCPLFWSSVDIYKEYDSLYIFKRNEKNSSFLCLWLFSWTITHSFGVPGWFTRPMTLSTCLSGMTKNSSFLHFRAVFMSYCPQFWGSRVIYKDYDT
jgi:hypothetical protein